MTLEQLLGRFRFVRLRDSWRVRCEVHNGYGVIITLPSPTRAAVACAYPCTAPECSSAALGTDAGTIDLDEPAASQEPPRTPEQDQASPIPSDEPPTPPTAAPRATPAIVKPSRADLDQEILRLHDEGLSSRKIARTIQVHHTTVLRTLERLRAPQGPA